MAEVLAVMAAPPAEDRPLVGRRLQLGLGQYGGDRRTILVLKLPRDGLAEIAIGLLDQPAILPVEHIAMGGELVGIAGQTKEMRSLPDQVERNVGKAKVDLQRGCMAAPFAKALAEDQRVVAKPL